MDEVIANVQEILEKYKDKINSTEQLAIIYWQKIDGCSINKDSISTPDFLYKATSIEKIIAAQRVLKSVKKEEESNEKISIDT